MFSPRPRASRRHPDRGASAVEFALIMPVLFLLIFGIIDYGLLFFDTIGLRQGTREGARQAVVQLPSASCTQAAFNDKVICATRQATENTLGESSGVRVKVYAPDPGGWAKGNRLIVCTQVKEKSITGFVPFPTKPLQTRTIMSIEQVLPAQPSFDKEEIAPAGGDWNSSWC
jgi:Flp pilus assembly protein TadG